MTKSVVEKCHDKNELKKQKQWLKKNMWSLCNGNDFFVKIVWFQRSQSLSNGITIELVKCVVCTMNYILCVQMRFLRASLNYEKRCEPNRSKRTYGSHIIRNKKKKERINNANMKWIPFVLFLFCFIFSHNNKQNNKNGGNLCEILLSYDCVCRGSRLFDTRKVTILLFW